MLAVLIATTVVAVAFSTNTQFTLTITPQYFVAGQSGTETFVKAEASTGGMRDTTGDGVIDGDGIVQVVRCNSDGTEIYGNVWTLTFNPNTGEARPAAASHELGNFIPQTSQSTVYYYRAWFKRETANGSGVYSQRWSNIYPVYVANAIPYSMQFSNCLTDVIDVVDEPYKPGSTFTGYNTVRSAIDYANEHWLSNPGTAHPAPIIIKRGSAATASVVFYGKRKLSVRAKPQSMCGGSSAYNCSFSDTGSNITKSIAFNNAFPNSVTKDTPSVYWQIQGYDQPYGPWVDIGTSTMNRYLTNGSPPTDLKIAQIYRWTCEWATGMAQDLDVFAEVWYALQLGCDGNVYYPFSIAQGMPGAATTAEVVSHHLGKCSGFQDLALSCFQSQAVDNDLSAYNVSAAGVDKYRIFRCSTIARNGQNAHQWDFCTHNLIQRKTGSSLTYLYDPSYGTAAGTEQDYETDAVDVYFGNQTCFDNGGIEWTNGRPYNELPAKAPNDNPSGVNWKTPYITNPSTP
jgi:hypothetical protein